MSRQEPLRVAHVINTLGLGGVPTAAWQLLRHLPRERYAPCLYVLGPGQGEDAARQQRLASFRAIDVEVTVAGDVPRARGEVATHQPPPMSRPRLTPTPLSTSTPASTSADDVHGKAPGQAAATWRRVAELSAWLRGQAVDIVHTHSYKPNLHGRLAAALLQRRGLRVVAHYHNQYDDKWDVDASDLLERELAPASDALLACSAVVARQVETRLELPAGRVQVLHNGVDTDVFHRRDRSTSRAALGLAPHRPVIAIVGRISRQKAQDDFVRAAAVVARARPDALFLIVGSSDDAALLDQTRALASQLGLGEQQLRFTGHVDGAAAMAELYSAVDLLVAPSRWEGFGLMLVEAMACGTPIVASRVGAIPDVVVDGHTADLVAPGDVAALASAIDRLLGDPARLAAMAAQAPARALDFSWQASAARLTDLYDQLITSEQPTCSHPRSRT